MEFRVCDLIRPNSKGQFILCWEVFQGPAFDTARWNYLLAAPKLQIDLEEIQFFAHDGLIWIGFICLSRQKRGLTTYVTLPRDLRTISFIKYLGLHYLQGVLGFTLTNEYLLRRSEADRPATSTPSPGPHTLRLVTGTNWSQVGDQAALHIKNFMIERLGTSRLGSNVFERLQPFGGTLKELIHNICLHAGEEEGDGVGLVGFTPPPQSFSRIRFCCADNGPGFRATLSSKSGIRCVSNNDAIVEALLFRYFKYTDGIAGLYKTLDYIYEEFGRIGIRTGDTLGVLDLSKGLVRERFEQKYGQADKNWLKSLLTFTKCPSIPGTHIFVDLMLPQERRRPDAYN